jgi:hypothetical protein
LKKLGIGAMENSGFADAGLGAIFAVTIQMLVAVIACLLVFVSERRSE